MEILIGFIIGIAIGFGVGMAMVYADQREIKRLEKKLREYEELEMWTEVLKSKHKNKIKS